MKKENKLQLRIKHIKTMFYTFISGQFKEKSNYNVNDWFHQHSWFERKWFIHKLKRLIMGFIYKISNRIDDLTCEKYYYDFVFGDMFCEAKMPVIFYAHNYENVRMAIGQINGDLVEKFRFTLLPTNNIEKLTNKTLITKENLIRNANNRSYGGSINLATRFGKTTESTILDYLNVDKDNILLGNFIEKNTKIDFTVIRDKNNYLRQFDNSMIIITFINNELTDKAINCGIGTIDRMKEIIRKINK